MRSLGGPEIIVIAVVFLLLFGGAKIPSLAKGLGEGIRNFKSSMKGEEETPPKQKPK
jgi:sec-independent protein translocase protein TatA